MGLPLLNALFAMVVSLSLMAVVGTRVLDVVDWTPQLAAMIGIGVGIDYALLILNRFRLERGAGRDVREATLISLDTSGRAVLFAGIVVVIAMLGMLLLGISFLYGPAIGAALSVLATMLAVADADAGDPRHPDRPPDQEGRRRTTRRRGDGLRRPLERLRRAPPAAGGDRRARRPARARGPALHMRLATSDASTYKKDDTTRDRLRPAQGGLRRRLQRAAAARRRAAQGGRPGARCSRSATRWASRTGSPRSCRRSSTRPATRRR